MKDKYLNKIFSIKLSLLNYLVILFLLLCVLKELIFFKQKKEFFEKSIKGPIEPDYPELLQYIQREVLIPPSVGPYFILGKDNPANEALEESEIFYRNISQQIFRDKYGGFFIEAGALDGESMSNTLGLEMDQNWSGLLVEADENAFKEMISKNRKAWLANVCLSPNPYPEKVLFSTRSQYYNSKEVATYGFKMRSMNGLASYVNPILLSNSWFKPVQCFPLESLLLSLGVSKIDLLSLDVEGAEKDIIANFPFHKFRVEVIYVECRERFIFDEVAHELSVKGFRLFGQFKDDSVFVKNDTIYQTFTLH